MRENLSNRLKKAWNAFFSRDPTVSVDRYWDYGPGYSIKPDRIRLNLGNERTIIASIYNRIGIDVASNTIRHVKVDQNGSFIEEMKSSLNECLSFEANIDQTGRSLIQDIAMSLCDEGCVAIVPVDTDKNPLKGSYEILTLRTAEIIEWYPRHVRLRAYNDRTGQREEFVMPKSDVAIVENPLYSVMNEPNSTLRRLNHKLSLLDTVDEQNSSGKLDLLIQLPYTVKSEMQKKRSEQRRKDIEVQLTSSKYGIAYIDATERVTQLNRPVENTLQTQIESLTRMLYSQLGLTENIINGTATEEEYINYYNRTIEPITSAITDAMNKAFLTKTARTQGQRIMSFRDPFKNTTSINLANILNTFKRDEIITSNEARAKIGFKPSSDPRAEELRNANITARDDQLSNTPSQSNEEENQNGI